MNDSDDDYHESQYGDENSAPRDLDFGNEPERAVEIEPYHMPPADGRCSTMSSDSDTADLGPEFTIDDVAAVSFFESSTVAPAIPVLRIDPDLRPLTVSCDLLQSNEARRDYITHCELITMFKHTEV